MNIHQQCKILMTFSLLSMKSGNPGYNTGLPVLYGYLNSSNEIQEYVSGLSIQYPFLTSMCPISPVEKNFVPIGFGYDAVTGCILKLSKEELRSFCCSGASGSCLDGSAAGGIQNSPYVSSTGIPFYLNFTDGYAIHFCLNFIFILPQIHRYLWKC